MALKVIVESEDEKRRLLAALRFLFAECMPDWANGSPKWGPTLEELACLGADDVLVGSPVPAVRPGRRP